MKTWNQTSVAAINQGRALAGSGRALPTSMAANGKNLSQLRMACAIFLQMYMMNLPEMKLYGDNFILILAKSSFRQDLAQSGQEVVNGTLVILGLSFSNSPQEKRGRYQESVKKNP